MKRPLLAVAAALLLAPATASASTVHLGPAPDSQRYPYPGRYLTSADDALVYYDAAPGEANRLTVSYSSTAEGKTIVTLADPGAAVSVSGGQCTSLGPHAARCIDRIGSGQETVPQIETTQARLGDGADELHATGSGLASPGGVIAFGGPGDDLIVGGPRSNELEGGGGHDRLFGGPDGDVLSDRDAVPDSDVIDGGSGDDLVSYRGRRRGVTVDLATDGPAGEPGEKDVVRNVEGAIGGGGSDRLLGTEGRNDLFGGGGGDLLVGHGESDTIKAGRGRDNMRGGDGGDVIYPGAGRDRLSCGSGRDSVIRPQAGELLRGPCEGVGWAFAPTGDFPWLGFSPNPVAVRRRSIDFRIECPQYDDDAAHHDCDGELFMRAQGRRRPVGHATFAPNQLGRRVARVHLNRRGRRLLRRRRGFVATLSLHIGDVPHVAWTIRLRR